MQSLREYVRDVYTEQMKERLTFFEYLPSISCLDEHHKLREYIIDQQSWYRITDTSIIQYPTKSWHIYRNPRDIGFVGDAIITSFYDKPSQFTDIHNKNIEVNHELVYARFSEISEGYISFRENYQITEENDLYNFIDADVLTLLGRDYVAMFEDADKTLKINSLLNTPYPLPRLLPDHTVTQTPKKMFCCHMIYTGGDSFAVLWKGLNDYTRVEIWNFVEKKLIRLLECDDTVVGMDMDDTGKYIVALTSGGDVKLFQVRDDMNGLSKYNFDHCHAYYDADVVTHSAEQVKRVWMEHVFDPNDLEQCFYEKCKKYERFNRRFLVCKGCKKSKYCSNYCYQQHWQIHKSQCKVNK
jgi:uncharacterized protein YeaO (DUF488 family)